MAGASEPEDPAANPVGGDESQRRRRRLEGDTVAVLIAAATASAQAAWMASYDVNGPRSVGRRGVRSMQEARRQHWLVDTNGHLMELQPGHG
jgi:hypothetical protein